MKPIDSKKKQLTGQEIITRAVYATDLKGLDPQVALIGIAKELTMDSVEPKQYGNSVFIGHYIPDRTGVYMRVLNIDTAKNLIDNGERYFKYLISNKVDKIYTEFDGSEMLHAFKLFSKRPGTEDMTFRYYDFGKDRHGVEVLFTPTKD